MDIINVMGIVWFAAAAVFAIAEALTMGITSIWFAGGALLAGIAAMFTDSVIIQIGIFLGVSAVLVAVTRPIAKRHINDRTAKTNVEAVVGSKGIAITDIKPNMTGRVRADGKEWSAVSEYDINEGSEVEIIEIKGVTLFVK